jgi:hypothetical protein
MRVNGNAFPNPQVSQLNLNVARQHRLQNQPSQTAKATSKSASMAAGQLAAFEAKLKSLAGTDMPHTLVELSQTQNAFQSALHSSSNLLKLLETVLAPLS